MTPPGEFTRPLVPDVAFLSYATLPRDAASGLVAIPAHPPTVAVEILSPDDRPKDVEDKISTYLRSGTLAILVVDPAHGTIVIHSSDTPQHFVAGNILAHSALPEFALDVAAFFERARH